MTQDLITRISPESTRMHQEAGESGQAVARFLSNNQDGLMRLGERLRRRPPVAVTTCARGSSDHAATYAKYMIEDDRWEEQADFFNGRTRGNSHSKMLDVYMRMLAEYRRVRSRRRPTMGRDYPLTLDELEAIAAERVHPDNR